MVDGDVPFYLKFWAKLTPSPLQKTDMSYRYWLVAPQPLHIAKKSSIIANRRSTTGFPMSLEWTAYVASKPPSGAQKRKASVFRIKVDFFRRKSATTFLCVKTFSGKVVRHSLAYLSVHNGFMVPTWNFGPNWPTPLKNADFESIFPRSTSTIIPRGKVQLSVIGRPLRAF